MDWIPCKVRLPAINQDCIVLRNLEHNAKVIDATRMPEIPGGNVWFHCADAIWCGLETISHWMPLSYPNDFNGSLL